MPLRRRPMPLRLARNRRLLRRLPALLSPCRRQRRPARMLRTSGLLMQHAWHAMSPSSANVVQLMHEPVVMTLPPIPMMEDTAT